MNKEEVMKLAREAGPLISTPFDVWCERFAALAAAAEREKCAKVCEWTAAAWTEHDYNSGCADCAAAIRNRGKE